MPRIWVGNGPHFSTLVAVQMALPHLVTNKIMPLVGAEG